MYHSPQVLHTSFQLAQQEFDIFLELGIVVFLSFHQLQRLQDLALNHLQGAFTNDLFVLWLFNQVLKMQDPRLVSCTTFLDYDDIS